MRNPVSTARKSLPSTPLRMNGAGIDLIAAAFAHARDQGRSALVSYVMAGDPDLAGSRTFAQACARGGADLIELGVPFSDPVADGPVIQRAGERALARGTTLKGCLALARSLEVEVPVLLMSYVNPICAMGEEPFARACARSKVSGVIVPDLPPEEVGALSSALSSQGVALVSFVSPVTPPARRRAALGAATGFVYFVSVAGVTGARRALPVELPSQLATVRSESPVPVVVGFGVSTPAQAALLGDFADGVVVGSAIVARGARPGPLSRRAASIRGFVASLRNALRSTPC